MPMPFLKPLVDAANTAYQDIRKAKEASYLHNIAASAGSWIGIQDTSGIKKAAFQALADFKPEGSAEEQTRALRDRIENLGQYSNDGTVFRALLATLIACLYLGLDTIETINPDRLKKTWSDFNIEKHSSIILAELKNPEHVFFIELKKFITSMTDFAQELLKANLQELALAEQKLKAKMRVIDTVPMDGFLDRNAGLSIIEEESNPLSESKNRHHTQAVVICDKRKIELQKKALEEELKQKDLELESRHQELQLHQKQLQKTELELTQARREISDLKKDKQVKLAHKTQKSHPKLNTNYLMHGFYKDAYQKSKPSFSKTDRLFQPSSRHP